MTSRIVSVPPVVSTMANSEKIINAPRPYGVTLNCGWRGSDAIKLSDGLMSSYNAMFDSNLLEWYTCALCKYKENNISKQICFILNYAIYDKWMLNKLYAKFLFLKGTFENILLILHRTLCNHNCFDVAMTTHPHFDYLFLVIVT